MIKCVTEIPTLELIGWSGVPFHNIGFIFLRIFKNFVVKNIFSENLLFQENIIMLIGYLGGDELDAESDYLIEQIT